jgi:hypothetical protein
MRRNKTYDEREAIKASIGFSSDTRETITSAINKMIARGSSPSDVQMVWFRLLMLDREKWEPLYKIWCTKAEPLVPKEPELQTGFKG